LSVILLQILDSCPNIRLRCSQTSAEELRKSQERVTLKMESVIYGNICCSKYYLIL